MSFPVLKNPHPSLRQKSMAVDLGNLKDQATQDFIDELMLTMKDERGIGIAAPQVGRHDRIIIVENQGASAVFVNPKIISKSWRKMDSEEGCLSVPDVWGMVRRHRAVAVRGFDRFGEPMEVKAEGLASCVFQHEIDHLDGILFIDRMTRKISQSAKADL